VGISVTALPTVNAVLNGTCALLLATGFVLIRRRRIVAHRACMQAAFAVSVLFLISYLVYHVRVGSVPFPGQGWIRPVYFAILISHTALAALVPPLALTTLVLGLRARYHRHRRIARWTLPIWLYVSVTGVAVYWMLYRLAPR
jgi:putative membrane protein